MQLKVEPIWEDLGKLKGNTLSAIQITFHSQFLNLPFEARGEADNSVTVLSQEFLVHSRSVIETFQIAGGAQLHQVLVAGVILCKKDEMVIPPAAIALGGLVESITLCHVCFASDDRLDSVLLCFLVETNGGEHVAVLRYADGVHAEIRDSLQQGGDLLSAVQETVICVIVEVYELGGHRSAEIDSQQTDKDTQLQELRCGLTVV